MRTPTCIGLLLLLGCSLGLYQVKYMVRDVKKDVAHLTAQLSEEQKQMHVLDAEWAHLIRPDRLARLSAEHLSLMPASAKQMQQGVEVIPVRDIEPANEPALQSVAAALPASSGTPAPVALLTASPVSYAH